MLVSSCPQFVSGCIYGIMSPSLGGELFAKVVRVTQTNLVVHRPLTAIQQAQGGLNFVPAFPIASSSAEIFIPLLGLVSYEVSSEFKAMYDEKTSDIVLPQKQGIII